MKLVNCTGLTFKNPLGLVADPDKDEGCTDTLDVMGFRSIEIGIVVPCPQSGNDKLCLFRLVDAEGLTNRMGSNNPGIGSLAEDVKKIHYDGILGINIGKSKDTSVEQGKDDYLICMEKIYAYTGHITINTSSPNTSGLRILQYSEVLDDPLITIKNKQNDLQVTRYKYVSTAVKIALDLSEEELTQVVNGLVRHNTDGVITTNTILDRSLAQGMKNCDQAGGLSGRLLQLKSTEIICRLSQELNGHLPIIGADGTDSIIVTHEKIAMDASLAQIYFGLILEGPSLIKEVVTHI